MSGWILIALGAFLLVRTTHIAFRVTAGASTFAQGIDATTQEFLGGFLANVEDASAMLMVSMAAAIFGIVGGIALMVAGVLRLQARGWGWARLLTHIVLIALVALGLSFFLTRHLEGRVLSPSQTYPWNLAEAASRASYAIFVPSRIPKEFMPDPMGAHFDEKRGVAYFLVKREDPKKQMIFVLNVSLKPGETLSEFGKVAYGGQRNLPAFEIKRETTKVALVSMDPEIRAADLQEIGGSLVRFRRR